MKPSGYGRMVVAAKRRWPVIALLVVGVALFLTGVVSIGPGAANKTADSRRQQHKDLDEAATAIKTSVAAEIATVRAAVAAEVTATVKAAVAAEVATVRAAVAAEVTATIKAAVAAATVKASKPEAGSTKQLKFATATVKKAKPKAGSTKQLTRPPQSSKAGGTKQLKFAVAALSRSIEKQVSNRMTGRAVSQFQPGTLNQSKIEVFKQCQLPNHSRGFDLQICGVAENRQWLWITTPKVASTTATRVWGKDGIRALQVGPACEVLAADQNGSDRQKIDQVPQGKDKFDGKTYNTSSVKFGFVRDPFDKLLSAVEEVMFRVLQADIDNFPGITKEAFERARLTTVWDRTLRVGTSLIKKVLKNWDRTLEFGAKRGVWRGAWKGELSSSKAYKELVTANLQDYLQRLEQGDAQLPAWDVHFVPQTEWFSSHGLPFHNLRALMDITQRGPADQVSSMPKHS